ncbi:MAG: amidohydrolase family protein [Candidatus Binatus sp.]|nr:amidohydrolase family protein [Candidatus Binatus sp.]
MGLEGSMMNEKIEGHIDALRPHRFEEARRGAWEPSARLADQDLDNLRAEVIYPGVGLGFFALNDAAFQRAVFRAYNDWLIDFCRFSPNRLLGAGLLTVKGPIEWAIEEARRVAKSGLRSVSIQATVPERPYGRSETYEPLWAALQDLGLPVAIHTGTGVDLGKSMAELGPGMFVLENKIIVMMRAVGELIWSGIPQRYPKLRFVLVEGGIGWIASLLRFMDHWWEDHHRWMEPKLDEPPSAYFHRQFWATFEDDRPGLLTRELLNVDHLMWGADYPHTEGTFPNSRAQVAKDFKGIPVAEVLKMVSVNGAKLYGVA